MRFVKLKIRLASLSAAKQIALKTKDVTVKRTVVCLISFLLLPFALTASVHSSDDNSLMIKVLQAETVPLQIDSSTVTAGCGQADYSASCMHASDQFVQNVMVVQSEDGRKFTIACTIESRWSNCIPLPVGESFRARIGKNDLTVVYLGSKGRPRKQHYRVLPEGAFNAPPAAN